MQAKLLISIDTEPDNQWDLNLRKNPQFRNIYQLGRLQRLFDKFSAKPTYLVTYSVTKSDSVTVLKDIAKSVACEIGTHLHTWETPPFGSPLKGDGSYLHQYPLSVQQQKMANVDSLISETFRKKPVSYRGGRYSFDKSAAVSLAQSGYFVDTSVTPAISWETDGGTNFKKFSHGDYFLQAENESCILEVPVSIKIRTRLSNLANFIYLNTPNWTHAEGVLRRLTGFNIIWLDPSFNAYEDMRWASDTLLTEGARYLNIMFHSCVIVPGGSPYSMDQQKTGRFFERLERILDYLLNVKKLESLTLREFYQCRKGSS